ncbi:hypothetical protein MNB_SV-15-1580 [hydrothermal vent metagenome]|uniref:Uncharacterized protein n=1 Tax=hydrothermal vent metagenome TaxID=652676 RepID=A0A1W1EK62_9ZZZZ
MIDKDLNILQDVGNMPDINNITQGVTQSIDDGSFMWGIFFGIVGMSYSMYGKKSDKSTFLYSGFGLMGYTYVVTGLKETILIGVLLTAIPFFIKK